MIGFIVLILLISLVFVWMLKTGAFLKIHKSLKNICDVGFLYAGVLIILAVNVFNTVSGMKLTQGEIQITPASETDNVLYVLSENALWLSSIFIYSGMILCALSFLSKIWMNKYEGYDYDDK
ncbi:hypothetical protein BSQ98_10330 [Serratia liquefaciens]|uniref:hypothetical protein n=1 Tax=Serratia liquefaciens TaxID=614 RepID=UPI0010225874|nr:hypothetical protein [Serratia liquefaciens]RYM64446.1 hypothetical protein BSQ98_10330 [Serratia liquefaciens]